MAAREFALDLLDGGEAGWEGLGKDSAGRYPRTLKVASTHTQCEPKIGCRTRPAPPAIRAPQGGLSGLRSSGSLVTISPVASRTWERIEETAKPSDSTVAITAST